MNGYSLQELASWARGQYVETGFWTLSQAQNKPDREVVIQLLQDQSPEKAEEIA